MIISRKVKEVEQMNFEQMMLQKAYLNVKGFGDRLALMRGIIDWERFRPIIASVLGKERR